MSIYTKTPSNLSTSDLQGLLQENAAENVRLEFKLEIPSKDETLKKLSAFANTFGGYLVIGARADSTDGRIQALPGVNPENGYKQRIVQWCFDGVSPPLTAEVSDPVPTPAGDGKVCYVIFVEQSAVAPHFLNGRRGVLVRIDEFSARFEAKLANETELRYLFDRRKMIQERRIDLIERAKKRFDIYLAKGHTDVGGQRTRIGPLLGMCFVPRFPSRQVCQQEALKEHLLKRHLNWRGTIFPDFSRRQILWQHESAIVLDAAIRTSYLEVNEWGMIFYGTQLETTYQNMNAIHPFELVGNVLLFIQHASALLRDIGFSGPVVIETALGSILDASWFQVISGSSFVVADEKTQLDDDVAFSLETTAEVLAQKPDGVAIDVLRRIFFGVNRPDFVETLQHSENLIRKGYEYNAWVKPTTLKL